MSHVRPLGLDVLHLIADEVRLVFEEDGHVIASALQLDSSFRRSARVETELRRALILKGVTQGASRNGVYFVSDSSTVTLTVPVPEGLCHFRVLWAKKRADGTYAIPTNAGSTWGELDPNTFEIETHWVIGFTLNEEFGSLGELFAAEVLGATNGRPGRLRLGQPMLLGSSGTSPFERRFEGADPGLPGFDDIEDGMAEDA
jgi:hypothetical protein